MVIDANVLIAYLEKTDRNHGAAAEILSFPILEIHAINFAEVVSHLTNRVPDDAEAILENIECLESLAISSHSLHRLAGRLHGRRPTKKVSLADCFAAALALTRNDTLVTSDRDLLPYAASDALKIRMLDTYRATRGAPGP